VLCGAEVTQREEVEEIDVMKEKIEKEIIF